jgi:spore coat polysaccharide biosynthesis protein SpsF
MKRKLVAAIACRNQGSRLYGKPIQNLDVARGVRILDNIVDCLRTVDSIDEIVLGISEGGENLVFRDIAHAKGLRFITGDEQDVLSRLIACGDEAHATDIFRVTSESPFPYFEGISQAWQQHILENADATFLDEVVDGCSFEIIGLETLRESHAKGDSRHRSELCTLFLREHHDQYRILRLPPPAPLMRKDLRLTVDNPEDLVVCRAIYQVFKPSAPTIPVEQIVRFLDQNPALKQLVAPFTDVGYATMYTWD